MKCLYCLFGFCIFVYVPAVLFVNLFYLLQSYTESVPQDLQVGKEVMRISATDIDDGNNSLVFYNLDNQLDSSYFRIDENSGVIYLNKTIDVSIFFSSNS